MHNVHLAIEQHQILVCLDIWSIYILTSWINRLIWKDFIYLICTSLLWSSSVYSYTITSWSRHQLISCWSPQSHARYKREIRIHICLLAHYMFKAKTFIKECNSIKFTTCAFHLLPLLYVSYLFSFHYFVLSSLLCFSFMFLSL